MISGSILKPGKIIRIAGFHLNGLLGEFEDRFTWRAQISVMQESVFSKPTSHEGSIQPRDQFFTFPRYRSPTAKLASAFFTVQFHQLFISSRAISTPWALHL